MKGRTIDELMYINDGILPYRVNFISSGLGYKPYLPNITGGMIGGMANWDMYDNLITQYIKNGHINNIQMDDYIDNIEDDNKLTPSERSSKLETEIYDMYNLLELEKEKNENFKNNNDPNKKISDKKIETLKENLTNYISKLINFNIKEKEIDDTIPQLIDIDKIKTRTNEEFNKAEEIAKDNANKLTKDQKYFSLNIDAKTQIENTNKNKDKMIDFFYINNERGNVNEDLLFDNPIPIQDFTGDFSKIYNSKDKDAYNKDLQKIFKDLSNEEFSNLFQYFPVDGIQSNTISEIKSFTRKDSKNPEDKQLYNDTKLYGYNNPYNEIKLSNDKVFKGSISYEFKYKNPSKSTNNEIRVENIITTIKGKIYNNKNNETKDIDIDNKLSLKNNTNGYKYIWVEFNKDNILMKNALDEKYFDIENKDGKKKILTDSKEEEYLEEFSDLYGEDMDIDKLKRKNSSKIINEILIKRKSPDFKLSDDDIEDLLDYYLDLFENGNLNEEKHNNIRELLDKNNYKLIRKNINKLFEDTLGNYDFLLSSEKSKINKLINIRNKIINKNPTLKKEYIEKEKNKKTNKIKAYASDTSFYPNIQVNNIVDNFINKNEKYENKKHIKRKY